MAHIRSGVAWLVVPCAVLALTSGCTASRDTFVVERTPQALAISPIGCQGPEDVEWLRITADDGPTVWEIEQIDPAAPAVERFVVGQVPPGFREVVPFASGRLGTSGQVDVDMEPADFKHGINLSQVPNDGTAVVIESYYEARPIRPSAQGLVQAVADDCDAQATKAGREIVVGFGAVAFGLGILLAGLVWLARRLDRRKRSRAGPPPPGGQPPPPFVTG